jgi:hypothetical protein
MKKNSVAIIASVASLGLLISGTTNAAAADKPIYMIVDPTAASAASISVWATAGDVIGGKTVAGVPDGMGAYANKDGTISVLSNHEISLTNSNSSFSSDDFAARTTRAYGGSGAFVTRFTIKPSTMQVTKVDEAIKKVNWYNYDTGKYQSTPQGPAGAPDSSGIAPNHSENIDRLCSAYLAPAGALVSGKKGWKTPLFFTGEEVADESRVFVLDPLTGVAYQAPRLGLAAWENSVVISNTGDDTIVFSTEDGNAGIGSATVSPATASSADLAAGSQLFLYRGTKTSTGTFMDRAGLNNGYLSVMKITGVVDETQFRTLYPTKGTKVAVTFPEINWAADGETQNIQARLKGSSLGALEDIAFNPANKNELYFVTKTSGAPTTGTTAAASQTASKKANPANTFTRDAGALWKITFENIARPQDGAQIELVLDGSEAPYVNQFDNIDFDSTGKYLMLQEDPGANEHLSRLMAYDTVAKRTAVVAVFDTKYFSVANSATYMTNDEESAGIINITNLLLDVTNTVGNGETFLFNAQIHPARVLPGTTTNVVNAEGPIAKQTAILRPDLTFADSAAEVAFKTKVIEGGQFYKLSITDWSKLIWQ